jgi:hypothetical protein
VLELPFHLASLHIGGHGLVAWLSAGACVASAVRHARKSQKLGPPAPAELLAELLGQSAPEAGSAPTSEPTRRAAIAELNQRLSDVSFELTLLPARLAALTRISLASGMALALLGYIGASSLTPFERLIGFAVCALAGLTGAAAVSAVGRSAKGQSARIRNAWDRASRETGKALGTSLRS